MRRCILLFTILLAAATLSARASAAPATHSSAKDSRFPVTIVDDHGNTIRLTKQPKRIVTLDPRDTEVVFALGLENRVVADSGAADEGATGIVNAQGKPRAFKYPSEWPS